MRRLSIATALTSVLALALAAAGPAAAAQSPVVGDCVAHGQLTQTYTEGQLRSALSTMSASVKEYTDCPDVIQRALLSQLGKPVNPGQTKSSSGSGGSFLPTPVIVVLVLLALAGVTFGAIAIRRRQAGPDSPGDDGPPPSES